ncbi:MAG: tetratricopeptide repeat protein [Leptolyngbya sp. SIO4C1]|nr:tetratricopeptide repeat protein [Leptolyngbya sp. SIO4C1]
MCDWKQLVGLVVLLLLTLGMVSPTAIAAPQTPDRLAIQAGVAAYAQTDYAQAAAAFSQAIEINPAAAVAYSNRCLVYLQLDEFSAAVSDCTQSLQLNPQLTEAYLNRGLAYYRIGQYGHAIADYQRLLQQRPDDHRAHYNLGLAQAAMGEHVQALASYDLALQHTAPEAARSVVEIYRDRGASALMLKRYQAAVNDFTQVIALDSDNTQTYFNRACCYHHLQEYLLALQDFSRVLAAAPDHARAYLIRGLVHQQLGNREDAIADMQLAAHYFQAHHEFLAHDATVNLIETLQSEQRQNLETATLAI